MGDVLETVQPTSQRMVFYLFRIKRNCILRNRSFKVKFRTLIIYFLKEYGASRYISSVM